MKVRELMDELESVLDEPEAEDFEVYFVIGNRQFKVTELIDGIQMGEYEDDLRMEKDGEEADCNVSLEHLAKIWLFAADPAEKLEKTVKKFRKED